MRNFYLEFEDPALVLSGANSELPILSFSFGKAGSTGHDIHSATEIAFTMETTSEVAAAIERASANVQLFGKITLSAIDESPNSKPRTIWTMEFKVGFIKNAHPGPPVNGKLTENFSVDFESVTFDYPEKETPGY
jgi:hypothetical protein